MVSPFRRELKDTRLKIDYIINFFICKLSLEISSHNPFVPFTFLISHQ